MKKAKKRFEQEVLVLFPELDLSYPYNCSFPEVTIGDKVEVSGKLSDEIGIVTEILGPKNESDYMQEIIRVFQDDDELDEFFNEKADEDQTPLLRDDHTQEVLVSFPELDLSYPYNCSFCEIEIGDIVCVEGKLSDEIGIITKIIGPMNTTYYMKNVREIIGKKVDYEGLYGSQRELVDTYKYQRLENAKLKVDLDDLDNFDLSSTSLVDENQKKIAVEITFRIDKEKLQNEKDYDVSIVYFGGESWDEEGLFTNEAFDIAINDMVVTSFTIDTDLDGEFEVISYKEIEQEESHVLVVKTIYHIHRIRDEEDDAWNDDFDMDE
jgi:rRNA processing protein Gar1